jgi:hypothetical protein
MLNYDERDDIEIFQLKKGLGALSRFFGEKDF